MSNIILMGETTRQVTEDEWRRDSIIKVAEPSMSLQQVLDWAHKFGIDINTGVKIIIDKSDEPNRADPKDEQPY